MQGACIVRRDLEGFIKTESILKSGLKLRLASCLPDLIITIRGKTNCFVLPAFSKADALCEGIDMALERLQQVSQKFSTSNAVFPSSFCLSEKVALLCTRCVRFFRYEQNILQIRPFPQPLSLPLACIKKEKTGGIGASHFSSPHLIHS
ncbi:hypothetical protein CEUSTIGMA_g3016.t1 [Chlamydomonas eustigma]|uniref:Uncharacterized protein n=1 Tax=Chlamydomonas eustigma TaxID=1157962 RepID=A0A250WXL0_9CHLO|nr:hypothetical protein CEUSTIGMA_g3016.t1 [Chlamydomonas eustigma]|eukprot:GAX75573.1 hypothetical protein CEUSTIGMA_g3016.t1 [Chlamydomonas eustigma]